MTTEATIPPFIREDLVKLRNYRRQHIADPDCRPNEGSVEFEKSAASSYYSPRPPSMNLHCRHLGAPYTQRLIRTAVASDGRHVFYRGQTAPVVTALNLAPLSSPRSPRNFSRGFNAQMHGFEPTASMTEVYTMRELVSQCSTTSNAWIVSRLQSFVQSLSRMSAEPDLSSAVDAIKSFVREQLDCAQAQVFTADPGTAVLIKRGDAEHKQLQASFGQGIAGYVAQTEETVSIVEAATDFRFDDLVDGHTPSTPPWSLLCVPLTDADGTVVGVLQAHDKDSDHFLPEDEIVLKMIATQAGPVLRCAMKYQSVCKENEQLSLQNSDPRRQADAELDAIFAASRTYGKELFGAKRSLLFLWDRVNEQLMTRTPAGKTLKYTLRQQPLLSHVCLTGEIVNVPDATQDPRFRHGVDKKLRTTYKSVLAMPVRFSDGLIVGVVQCVDSAIAAFSRNEERLLTPLLDQLALGIQNSSAWTNQDHDDGFSQERSRQTQTLSGTLTMVVESGADITRSDSIRILVIPSDKPECLAMMVANTGPGQTQSFEEDLPTFQMVGVTGWAVRHKTHVNLNHPYRDQRFAIEIDSVDPTHVVHETKTLLVMPIMDDKGVTLGVIQVLRKTDHPFTYKDESVVTMLARNAGVAITTSRHKQALAKSGSGRGEEASPVFTKYTTAEIMDAVVGQAAKAIGALRVQLLMSSEREEGLEVRTVDHDGDGVQVTTMPREDNGVASFISRTGECVVITDVSKDKRLRRERTLRGALIKDCVGVPLFKAGENSVFAVLMAFNSFSKTHGFDNNDAIALETIAKQATAALSTADKMKALRQEVYLSGLDLDRQKLLQECLLAVGADLDSDRLASLLGSAAAKLVDAESVSVFYYNKHLSLLHLKAVDGRNVQAQTMMPVKGLVGIAVNSRKTVYVKTNAAQHDEFDVEVDQRQTLRVDSCLCLPLLSPNEEVLAVLALANGPRRTFQAKDVEMAEIFCAHATLTLQQSFLFQKSVNALNFVRTISSELSLGEAMYNITNDLCNFLDAERATLFMVDLKRRELWSRGPVAPDGLTGVLNAKQENMERSIRVPIGTGIAGYVAETGKTLNIPDVRRDPRWQKEAQDGFVTKSMLCMAVRDNMGVIVAVVQALNKRGPSFTSEDETFLRVFGNMIGLYLRNAQLFEALFSAKKRHQMLSDSFVAFSNVIDHTKVPTLVARRGRALTAAESCCLFLIDNSHENTGGDGQWNRFDENGEITAVKMIGVAAQVMVTGEVLNIVRGGDLGQGKPPVDKQSPSSSKARRLRDSELLDDTAEPPSEEQQKMFNMAKEISARTNADDLAWRARVASADDYTPILTPDRRVHSQLCVPVFWEYRIIGVLQVTNNQSADRCFDAEDEDMLCALGRQAAVTLANARRLSEANATVRAANAKKTAVPPSELPFIKVDLWKQPPSHDTDPLERPEAISATHSPLPCKAPPPTGCSPMPLRPPSTHSEVDDGGDRGGGVAQAVPFSGYSDEPTSPRVLFASVSVDAEQPDTGPAGAGGVEGGEG